MRFHPHQDCWSAHQGEEYPVPEQAPRPIRVAPVGHPKTGGFSFRYQPQEDELPRGRLESSSRVPILVHRYTEQRNPLQKDRVHREESPGAQ